MNKKDASVMAEAVATKADEADTATDEETTIKEEDTKNTTKPRIIFFDAGSTFDMFSSARYAHDKAPVTKLRFHPHKTTNMPIAQTYRHESRNQKTC